MEIEWSVIILPPPINLCTVSLAYNVHSELTYLKKSSLSYVQNVRGNMILMFYWDKLKRIPI